MQSSSPSAALAGLLLIAAIVVWATSPSKWRTFKKMALAFVATVVLAGVLGFAIGYFYSSPPLTGAVTELGVYVGVISALVMGRQHVRALKKRVRRPMQNDKYVNDAKTWCAHGETFGRAAALLFRSGNPSLYFPAATLGHQALEMLLKAALIRQGLKISKADDDVWGHDLGGWPTFRGFRNVGFHGLRFLGFRCFRSISDFRCNTI